MRRLFRSLAAIFTPPFPGLGIVVVLYVFWAHLVYPHNDILRGNLPDPDDYMYLDQVLDWVNGQGWYDNIQHRLDPPAGTPIHFSRLAQLPMAAGVLLFKVMGLHPHGAAMVMALLYPFVLLGCGLVLMRRIAGFVASPRWAGATPYVALFSIGMLFEFSPGHVDHHGLVILIVMAAIACLLRLTEVEDDVKTAAKAAAGAGVILALSMVVALECLPWLLLISAWLGLWAMQRGGGAARSGAIYGVSLTIASIAGLALTRPPATILANDVLTYSITYVFLAAAIAVPFIGAALVAGAPRLLRWVVGLGLAGASGGVFLHYFPDLLMGPYGGIDPQLVPLLLDQVEEAKPILQGQNGFNHMLNVMGTGFIALPAAIWFTARARGRAMWQWALLTLVLGAAFLLSIFYQYRFVGMESVAAIPPLVAVLERGWVWAGRHLQGRRKVLAEIGLLLLIGPLPTVIFPALFDGRSFNVGFLLFPVDSGRTPCDMGKLQFRLRDPNLFGDRRHLIASAMDLGPEILFRSDEDVLAAPYHMDVQGNLDAARLLSTPYDQESQNIARRRGVDLIILCRAVPNYLVAPGRDPSLIERLSHGEVPVWLEHVHLGDEDNFVVYRVRPEQDVPDANAPQNKK